MERDDDWRIEYRISDAEANLVVDVDGADVITEIVFWVGSRARSGAFDQGPKRQRRRIRMRGWRAYESSRLLPPIMAMYEIDRAARVATLTSLSILTSTRMSLGKVAEEQSLPSVQAARALAGHLCVVRDWTFLDFHDRPANTQRSLHSLRAWDVCIEPAYLDTVSARVLPPHVLRALSTMLAHIDANEEACRSTESEIRILKSSDLPSDLSDGLPDMEIAYKVDTSSRVATILDVTFRDD